MKYITILILLLTIFLVYDSKNDTKKLTKVVVKVPNLTYDDINNYLKNEFNNISDIEFIDGSIVSNTIVLKVDEKSFNKTDVKNMLNRWGLEADGFSFLDISSSSLFE